MRAHRHIKIYLLLLCVVFHSNHVSCFFIQHYSIFFLCSAGFYGNGFLELPNHSLRKRANIGFVFRTLQADAMILLSAVPQQEITNNYYDEKDLRSNYSCSLVNGRLVFWADAGRGRIELSSNGTLNDGDYHTVNVLKMGRKFELRVDDEYQMSKSLTTQPFVINMIEGSGGFYVGGIPNLPEYLHLAEKLDAFHGTLKDFVVNNQTISFGDLVNSTNVSIGRDGPKMGHHELYNEMLMKTEPMSKSFTAAPEGCHRVNILYCFFVAHFENFACFEITS